MNGWVGDVPKDIAKALLSTKRFENHREQTADELFLVINNWRMVYDSRIIRMKDTVACLNRKQFNELKEFVESSSFLKPLKIKMDKSGLTIFNMDDVASLIAHLKNLLEKFE